MVIHKYSGPKSTCGYTAQGCVLAIGFFDGVHIAHRDLLKSAHDRAHELGVPLGVFTFSGAGSIKSHAARIYTDEQKARLLERLGVDFTVFADFGAVVGLSADDFVTKVLIDNFNCLACVAGFNFRFGNGAKGDARTLSELMQAAGREAIIKQEIAHGGETVSASRIRAIISVGNMKEAKELLGSPYFISGEVSHGMSLGRQLGYPTVNLSLTDSSALPRAGVYRCAVPIGEKIYTALTNVGICPTFGGREMHAETHILDFSGDLYGQSIDVYFLDYIREEMAFSAKEELIMQINIDKNKAISENGDITWQELGLK